MSGGPHPVLSQVALRVFGLRVLTPFLGRWLCERSGFDPVRIPRLSGPVPGRRFEPQAAVGPLVVVLLLPPSEDLPGVQ
jgi:hypothetical protein